MASRGVNKVILLGNVGGDPECRTFQSGDLVANFSLATSETWQDRNTGEDREKTEWHRCVAYRGLAGVVQKFVRKGSKLYIEGKLQTRKWTDQNGIDRYSTEILVDNMQMLDSRSGGSAPMNDDYHYNAPQHGGSAYQGSNQGRGRAPQQGHGGYADDYASGYGDYDASPAPPPSSGRGKNRDLPSSPVAPQNPDAGMSDFNDDDIPF